MASSTTLWTQLNDDPQHGKWGGKREANFRIVTVEPIRPLRSDPDNYRIALEVRSTDPQGHPRKFEVAGYIQDDWKATSNLTKWAKMFFITVFKTGERFGAMHSVDVLRGTKSQKIINNFHNELDVYGIGKELSIKQWQFLIRQFIQQEFVFRDEEYGV